MIVNYEQLAAQAEKAFYDNQDITKANKDIVRKYSLQHNVKPATLNKFFRNIIILLKEFKDFKKQMHDRDFVNNTFAILRKKTTSSYIATLINISKAMARWINDGELPKGFKDIKSVPKSEQRRSLKPEDMWTWTDAEHFAQFTNSIQLKAIIFAQLDAGMRPSEFIDLNYEDVKLNGSDIVIIHISNGKTGSRDVACSKCLPYLVQWLQAHPTKKGPLWVTEYPNMSHPNQSSDDRYNYYALLKRISNIAIRAGINKKCDFYTLRHSSCTIDKIENVPLELAAGRHGHTVEYFTQVYGRLDVNDLANRMRAHVGKDKVQNEKIVSLECSRCFTQNPRTNELCLKCGSPLTQHKAMELYQQQQDSLKQFAQTFFNQELNSIVEQLKVKQVLPVYREEKLPIPVPMNSMQLGNPAPWQNFNLHASVSGLCVKDRDQNEVVFKPGKMNLKYPFEEEQKQA